MSEEREREHARMVGAVIAGEVAAEMAPPLGELRDRLGLIVDTLDRHVALSTGPTPFPWNALQQLRQQLAQAYLTCASVARLAGELSLALAAVGAPMGTVEVDHEVEGAVHLSSRRLASTTELLVDTGSVPPARGAPGELMLAVAQLVLVCADSAAKVAGSALSVRTRYDAATNTVVIMVADNGGGAPDAAGPALAHVAAVASRAGGSCVGTSQEGMGSAFELRLPAA
ncbi:MAG TPA: hypothetical protein VL463_06885 [Kofleriaceae bacterium]|nr:hypothetical protein [Kofleriaceae bacterium]